MIKAYVINLETERERRERMCAQLREAGIPFEVFPAIDGRMLDAAEVARVYDEHTARAQYREMSRSEIGCALSHLAVYRRIVDDGIDLALVLEDDAQLGPDLPAVLRLLADTIAPEEPVVVLLSHVDKYTRWGSRRVGGRWKLVRRYGDWWLAHGYLVTRAAARRMIGRLRPVGTAADHWALFERRGVVNLRALVPYCIGLSALADASSIEPHRAPKHDAHRARRPLVHYLRHYGYRRFLHQILVRPFLRVRRQRRTF